MIRAVRSSDAEKIARIYNQHVLNTIVTFEETPVTAQEMAARIGEIAASSLPWLVAEESGNVLGYAYASRWKSRSAYRHSVEATIYLDATSEGRGLGSQLYGALIRQLRLFKIHAVMGGVSLPNEASVHLHEKLGFEKVAHFRQVGFQVRPLDRRRLLAAASLGTTGARTLHCYSRLSAN